MHTMVEPSSARAISGTVATAIDFVAQELLDVLAEELVDWLMLLEVDEWLGDMALVKWSEAEMCV